MWLEVLIVTLIYDVTTDCLTRCLTPLIAALRFVRLLEESFGQIRAEFEAAGRSDTMHYALCSLQSTLSRNTLYCKIVSEKGSDKKQS